MFEALQPAVLALTAGFAISFSLVIVLRRRYIPSKYELDVLAEEAAPLILNWHVRNHRLSLLGQYALRQLLNGSTDRTTWNHPEGDLQEIEFREALVKELRKSRRLRTVPVWKWRPRELRRLVNKLFPGPKSRIGLEDWTRLRFRYLRPDECTTLLCYLLDEKLEAYQHALHLEECPEELAA